MMDVQTSLAWPCQSWKHSTPQFGGESLSRAQGNRPLQQNCRAVVDPSSSALAECVSRCEAKPTHTPLFFVLCDAAVTWHSRRKTVDLSVALHVTCSENRMRRATPTKHRVERWVSGMSRRGSRFRQGQTNALIVKEFLSSGSTAFAEKYWHSGESQRLCTQCSRWVRAWVV